MVDAENGEENIYVGVGRCMRNFCTSLQFCCEPKSSPVKSDFKNILIKKFISLHISEISLLNIQSFLYLHDYDKGLQGKTV